LYPDNKANDINEYLSFIQYSGWGLSAPHQVLQVSPLTCGQVFLQTCGQVSLLTLMVGNLLEKSLALAAILTATWRATAL